MTGFQVRSLDETTWPDFARLVESHNGVWGGCWCMAFHAEGVGRASRFESQGFERTRRLGKHHWVVTRVVGRASS
jgi:hypothetical protein